MQGYNLNNFYYRNSNMQLSIIQYILNLPLPDTVRYELVRMFVINTETQGVI